MSEQYPELKYIKRVAGQARYGFYEGVLTVVDSVAELGNREINREAAIAEVRFGTAYACDEGGNYLQEIDNKIQTDDPYFVEGGSLALEYVIWPELFDEIQADINSLPEGPERETVYRSAGVFDMLNLFLPRRPNVPKPTLPGGPDIGNPEYDIFEIEAGLHVNLWLLDNAILFSLPTQQKVYCIPIADPEAAYLRLAKQIRERNIRHGLIEPQMPPENPVTAAAKKARQTIGQLYREHGEYASEQPWWPKPPVSTDIPAPGLIAPSKRPPDRLPAYVRHRSNRLGMGITRALGSPLQWLPNIDGFAYGMQPFKHGDVRMSIGLPKSEQAEALWRTLCKAGPVAVKTHFALWGTWYEAQNNRPNVAVVRMSINTMCEWLGYKKNHGAFPIQTKQKVRSMLVAFAQMEMKGSYRPKKGDPEQRFTGGRLWDVVLHEEQYGDLFGQAGEGDPEHWEPLQFAYRPGMAQLDEQWLSRNRFFGKVSSGLLRIPNDEEWALLIGGYLAFQGRINAYNTFPLRISTILAAISRGQTPDPRQRPMLQERFWRALDVLKEYCVIAEYQKPQDGKPVNDIGDFDDPDELADYFNENPEARRDWRAAVVKFTMPNTADMERLQDARKKAKETANATTRKRGRPKKIPLLDSENTST